MMTVSVLLSLAAAVLNQPRTAPADTLLVSTQWLAKHLKDHNLVLLQVGTKEDYDAGHIPGAQFIQLQDISAPQGGRLILELPTRERIDSALGARGISNNSRVVVYWSNDWYTPSARVALTLDWAGLRGRVFILDGGYRVWKAEGRATSTAPAQVSPASFTSKLRNDVVVEAAWVASNVKKPGIAIVDARDPEFYAGTAPERNGRPGHIAGAHSLPFTTMVQDSTGRMESLVTLKQRFESAGVKPGDLVVAYCHVGQQASLVYFAARLLGYQARLYDGSYSEWGPDAQYPVEK